MWYINTIKYYSAIKKNEIMPSAATGMNLEIIILSKLGQTERQISYAISYMWNLKKKIQINLFTILFFFSAKSCYMWNPNAPIRDLVCTCCIGRQILNHCTVMDGPTNELI